MVSVVPDEIPSIVEALVDWTDQRNLDLDLYHRRNRFKSQRPYP